MYIFEKKIISYQSMSLKNLEDIHLEFKNNIFNFHVPFFHLLNKFM